MKLRTLITAATLLAAAAGGAWAQGLATPHADQREFNQQHRIDHGMASGQLTAREGARMERRQGRINHYEARAKSDGVVTRHERQTLHRRQNHASARIHHQKHDRQHTH